MDTCEEEKNVIPVSIKQVFPEPQNNATWHNFDKSASDHYQWDILHLSKT